MYFQFLQKAVSLQSELLSFTSILKFGALSTQLALVAVEETIALLTKAFIFILIIGNIKYIYTI